MNRVVISCVAALAACSPDSSVIVDAPIDRPVDIGGLCGPLSDASPDPFLRADFTACGCCTANETVCVIVTADGSGWVTTIEPDATQPPASDVLACVQGRVIGRCVAGLAGTSMKVCVTGP